MTKHTTLPVLDDMSLGHTLHHRGTRISAIVLDHDASEWMGYHQPDGCDDSRHAANRRLFRKAVREALADTHHYVPGDVEIFATQDEYDWVAEVLEDGCDL